ncbi:very short patch repair endonuclease [Ancylobacter sp. G4_0304]|uniref:very short patch repair endonuclease n=1 Tax=Ancylobacter sp. G4_0304 TaxID=3114289 RepID=UPI0039C6F83E
MADIVPAEVRSRMMSGIRGRDTRPEMLLRRGLHAMGFRFRVSDRKLPGSPDMVFPRYRAVLFVHGCFWHGHDCHLFRLPGTRREFWQAKIESNRVRDAATEVRLVDAGWRVLTVWECALRGRARRPLDEVLADCAGWLRGDTQQGMIRGTA